MTCRDFLQSSRWVVSAVLAAFVVMVSSTATLRAEQQSRPDAAPAGEPAAGKVYGQWLIRVKPDRIAEYDKLIETRGLPLFRAAGGRMVGWWKTMIGNQYEQVTIWQYDDMAAYDAAVASLGKNERFAEFARLRDPLLAGEESQFLRLADGAEPPELPLSAARVVLERHRVPLARTADYLSFMTTAGASLLGKHGFRPIGPFVADVGNWSEVTYLFPFASLEEREKLRAAFGNHADAKTYGQKLSEFSDVVQTQVLTPAAFAASSAAARWTPVASPLLPHLVEVVPGVFAAGFANRHTSANCGWVVLGDRTVLIDLPRGVEPDRFLAEVERLSGKPPRTLVLTNVRDGDAAIVGRLFERGIEKLVTTPALAAALVKDGALAERKRIESISTATVLGSGPNRLEVLPLEGIVAPGGAAVHLAEQGVLFAGPLVVNGPHTSLSGSDTKRWVAALAKLKNLHAPYVVPGFGSWAATDALDRQLGFLTELRRQVGFVISQGRPHEQLQSEVRISAEHLVWAPYDAQQSDDVEHVYREMTVPLAPFGASDPKPSDGPHALVLYADQPHEPGYITECLPRVFDETGVNAHFTVDVRALSAENLAKVDLLVILRDGLQRPQTGAGSEYMWMTQQQQDAVVRFVERGGGFLNLHNSMGLYPPSGGYLDLVGGRYIGHGPLERFRVEVVDPKHPITHGVSDFSVADEQHTPPYDKDKVHLLLKNRSDDGKVAAAGWAYEPGKGRLCHLANGHTREARRAPDVPAADEKRRPLVPAPGVKPPVLRPTSITIIAAAIETGVASYPSRWVATRVFRD